jgi:alkylation response protein AidB-like acyl-CoA dehydrogenase
MTTELASPIEWRRQVRDFFATHCSTDVINGAEEDGTEFSEELYQAMVRFGYTGLLIPQSYGGLGGTHTQMAVFFEEAALAMVPHGVISEFTTSAAMAASVLLRVGNEKQRQEFFPKILDGSARFAIGFTEPEVGSDLAAVRLRARLDGDNFVLSGDKVFNSANLSTHMLVLARTDADAAKHQGISLILADLSAPGIQIRPLYTMRGWRRDHVAFDDVRQPRTHLLGELNRGWYHLMSLMDLERSGSLMVGEIAAVFSAFVAYLGRFADACEPPLRDSRTQLKLAELYRKMAIGRFLSERVMRLQERGEDATLPASYQKVYNSELQEVIANAFMDIVGPTAALEQRRQQAAPDPWPPAKGLLARLYKDARTMQIAGGTSEIQRNIIATRGLGLPRDA